MLNLVKKFLLSLFVFIVLFSSLAPSFSPAFAADSTWYNTNLFEWYIKVYDSPPNEIFGERYTAAQVQWVFWGVYSTIFNLPYTILGVSSGPSVCMAKVFAGTVDVGDCVIKVADFIKDVGGKIFAYNTNNTNSLAQNGGARDIFSKIFSENRPISAITYFKNIGRRFNLVPEAKAAESFGFSRISVIQDLWSMSRNAAYFIFTFLLIIVAFMVMFKIKISPQAVITIQSAIPKIFITLLLITFSYAIAGFLIDVLYIFMGIFSLFFKVPPLAFSSLGVFNFISGKGFGVIAIITSFGLFLILYLVAILITWLAASFSLNTAGVIFAFILGIFTIILFIIMLIDFFRILFALFKALAGFYLAVIIGPLQLSLGALPLPQAQGVFGSWIKSMIGKLAIFPLTGILFYLADIFLLKAIQISLTSLASGNIIIEAIKWIFDKLGYPISFNVGFGGVNVDKLWGPPMLANAQTASSIAFIFMALGALIIIPKIGKAVEFALAGRPFDYESAIGQNVKTPVVSIGSFVESVGHKMKGSVGGVIEGIGKVIQTIAQ